MTADAVPCKTLQEYRPLETSREHRPLTAGTAPVELASRAGVFKPSCSTPFTLFLCLVFVYRPFQLYFISKTPSAIPPFSAPFLQLISTYPTILLYLSTTQLFFIYSSYSLWSPSDPACILCAASVLGEDGILVAEVPHGVQHASLAWTSPRWVVELAQPNQSAGCALP